MFNHKFLYDFVQFPQFLSTLIALQENVTSVVEKVLRYPEQTNVGREMDEADRQCKE